MPNFIESRRPGSKEDLIKACKVLGKLQQHSITWGAEEDRLVYLKAQRLIALRLSLFYGHEYTEE